MRKCVRSMVLLSLSLFLILSLFSSCSLIESFFHVHSYEYFYNGESHWQICKSCGEATEKEAHTPRLRENLAPTCEHEGFKTFECSTCGYETTEFLPMEAHKYDAGTHQCATCGRTESTLVELSQSERYGYRYLASLEKSEQYLRVYKKLSAVIASRGEKAVLNEELTREELAAIYSCVTADHPEYFWLSSKYEFSYSGKEVCDVSLFYSVSAEELPLAKKAFEDAADKILASVTSSMTDFEKELYLHDAIVKSNTYDESYEAPMTHSSYGALVLGCSVCDGYSKLFHYFMARSGILSAYLVGYSGENHSWNAVCLDGDWYMVDPTWDDPVGSLPGTISHAYFNCTWEQFSTDHSFYLPSGEPIENYYEIPVCNSERYYYFPYFGYEAILQLDRIERVLLLQAKEGKTTHFQIRITGLTGTAEEKSAAIHNYLEDETALYATVSHILGRLDPISLSYGISKDGTILNIFVD